MSNRKPITFNNGEAIISESDKSVEGTGLAHVSNAFFDDRDHAKSVSELSNGWSSPDWAGDGGAWNENPNSGWRNSTLGNGSKSAGSVWNKESIGSQHKPTTLNNKLRVIKTTDIIKSTEQNMGVLGDWDDTHAHFHDFNSTIHGGSHKYGQFATTINKYASSKGEEIDAVLPSDLNKSIFIQSPFENFKHSDVMLPSFLLMTIRKDEDYQELINRIKAIDVEELYEDKEALFMQEVNYIIFKKKKYIIRPVLSTGGEAATDAIGGNIDKQGVIKDMEDIKPLGFDPDDVLTGEPLNGKLITRAYEIIKSQIKTSVGQKYKVTKPSKRIHVRNVARNLPINRFIGERTMLGDKIKILMMVDCSGSMDNQGGGYPIKDAAILVTAINRITQENPDVEGTAMYVSCDGTFTIPMPYIGDDIQFFNNANKGSENIGEAVEAHMDLITESDVVFCFTDGSISGKAVDKKKLTSLGSEIIGIYANKIASNPTQVANHFDKNSKWFHKVILRTDVLGLANLVGAEMVKKAR